MPRLHRNITNKGSRLPRAHTSSSEHESFGTTAAESESEYSECSVAQRGARSEGEYSQASTAGAEVAAGTRGKPKNERKKE